MINTKHSITTDIIRLIVNNLKFKEKTFHGAFTFIKRDRKSQNDLILGNIAAIEAVEEFKNSFLHMTLPHSIQIVLCEF